jgi:hypothetical protein
MIQERSRSPGWRELTELLSDLPYPAAAPLARFISERDSERRVQRGREAAESLLTVGAYVVYLDLCARRSGGGLFKGFTQRSAGPLWGLIRACIVGNEAKLDFAAALAPLTRPDNAEQIDLWIGALNSDKHGRRQAMDWISFLGLLGNHVARVFENKRLGVFESVVAKRFHVGSYTGIFRVLHGSSQTFVDVYEYSGPHQLSDEMVYIVDPASGRALPLSPLYLWGLERNPADPSVIDMHEYDTDRRSRFGYKSTQPSEGLEVAQDGDFVIIHQQLVEMRGKDQSCIIMTDLNLTSYEN